MSREPQRLARRRAGLFLHHSGIAGSGFKSLQEGAKVSYEVQDGPKGPNASNVQLV